MEFKISSEKILVITAVQSANKDWIWSFWETNWGSKSINLKEKWRRWLCQRIHVPENILVGARMVATMEQLREDRNILYRCWFWRKERMSCNWDRKWPLAQLRTQPRVPFLYYPVGTAHHMGIYHVPIPQDQAVQLPLVYCIAREAVSLDIVSSSTGI